MHVGAYFRIALNTNFSHLDYYYLSIRAQFFTKFKPYMPIEDIEFSQNDRTLRNIKRNETK